MWEEDKYDPQTVLDGITDTVICEVLLNTVVADLADKKDYTFDSLGEENDACTTNYNKYQDIYVRHNDVGDQLDIDNAEKDEFEEDGEGNVHEESGQIFYSDDSKDDKYIIGFETDIKDSTSLTESTEDEKYEFKIEFESTEMATDFDDEINGSSSLTDEEYEFENDTKVIDVVKIINKTTPQMFRPRIRSTVSCKLKKIKETSRKIKKLEHDVKNLQEKVQAINKVKKKVMEFCKRCKNTKSTIPFPDDCSVSKNIAPKQLPWKKGDENPFPEDNDILNQANTMRILRGKNNKYNKMHHIELKGRKFVAKQQLKNALFAIDLKITFKFLLSRNLMCTLEQMNYVSFVGDLQAECKKYPYLNILENSSNVYLRKTSIQQVESSVFKIQKSDRVALFQTKSECETFAAHYRGNSLAAISGMQIGNKMKQNLIQIICRHAPKMQMHKNRRASFKAVPVFPQDQIEVHKCIHYESAILDSISTYRGCKDFGLKETPNMCILQSIQAKYKAYVVDYKRTFLFAVSETYIGNEIVNIVQILCNHSTEMQMHKNRAANSSSEFPHIEVHKVLCYARAVLESRTTYGGCEGFKLKETHTVGIVRSMQAEYAAFYKGKSLAEISSIQIGKEMGGFIQILCRHVSKFQMNKNKAAMVKIGPEFHQIYREAHESLCVENAILDSSPHYRVCTNLKSKEIDFFGILHSILTEYETNADNACEMWNFIQILSRRVYKTERHKNRAAIVTTRHEFHQVHREAHESIRVVNAILDSRPQYRNCNDFMVINTTSLVILLSIQAEYKVNPVHYKGKSFVAVSGMHIGSQMQMHKNNRTIFKTVPKFPPDQIEVQMSICNESAILDSRSKYRDCKDFDLKETPITCILQPMQAKYEANVVYYKGKFLSEISGTHIVNEIVHVVRILCKRSTKIQMHKNRSAIFNSGPELLHIEVHESICNATAVLDISTTYRGCEDLNIKKTLTSGIVCSIQADYESYSAHYKEKYRVSISGTQIGNEMVDVIQILCRHSPQILIRKTREGIFKTGPEFQQDEHRSLRYPTAKSDSTQTGSCSKGLKLKKISAFSCFQIIPDDSCASNFPFDEKIESKTIGMLLNPQQFTHAHRKAEAEDFSLKKCHSFFIIIVIPQPIDVIQNIPVITEPMQTVTGSMILKNDERHKVWRFFVLLPTDVILAYKEARNHCASTESQESVIKIMYQFVGCFNNQLVRCLSLYFMHFMKTNENLGVVVNTQGMEFQIRSVLQVGNFVMKILLHGKNEISNDANWIIQQKNAYFKTPFTNEVKNKGKIKVHNSILFMYERIDETSTIMQASKDYSVPVFMLLPSLFFDGQFANVAKSDGQLSHRRNEKRHSDTFNQSKYQDFHVLRQQPENINEVVSNYEGLFSMSLQRKVKPGIADSAIINCFNKFEGDINLLSYEDHENVGTFVDVTNGTDDTENINEAGIVATGIEERGAVHAIHANTENIRCQEIILTTPTSDGEHSTYEICTSMTTFNTLRFSNSIPFRSRFKTPPAGGSIGQMELVNTCPIDGFLFMIYSALDCNIYIRKGIEHSTNKLHKLYFEIWQSFKVGNFGAGKIAWCVHSKLISLNDISTESSFKKTVDLFGEENKRVYCVLGQHSLSVERYCTSCSDSSFQSDPYRVIPIYNVNDENLAETITKAVKDYPYKQLEFHCNIIRNGKKCHGKIVQHFDKPPLIIAVNLFFLKFAQHCPKSSDIPDKVEINGVIYNLTMVRFYREDVTHFVDKVKIDGTWTIYDNKKEGLYFFDEDPDGVLLSSCYYVLDVSNYKTGENINGFF